MPGQKSLHRDNFTSQTKRVLAGRVAYRCSFPDCGRITVGADSSSSNKILVLGEAAHIHAAAGGGPRYVSEMTVEKRKSIENGIWMCRMHARLIDADQGKYSAETLLQWKNTMEAQVYRELKDLRKDAVRLPTIIICVNFNLMFEGVWKSVEGDSWTFLVKKFIIGNEYTLKNFSVNSMENESDYIIVESQGDGRLIRNSIRWMLNSEGEYEVCVQVLPRFVRRDPNNIGGDFALGPDGDLLIENGDFKIISGKDYAKRLISDNLGIPIGSYSANVLLGSRFNEYYKKYKNNAVLLNRLVKVELTRLTTIPITHTGSVRQPELNFVSRILEVSVLNEVNHIVTVFLSLEWGDNSLWTGNLYVKVLQAGESGPGTLLSVADPLHRLKTLTARPFDVEVKEKVNMAAITKIFSEILPEIMVKVNPMLVEEVLPLFVSNACYRTINDNNFEYFTSIDLEAQSFRKPIRHIGLTLRLEGFKRAGLDTFSITQHLFFFFDEYTYEVGSSRSNTWFKQLYDFSIDDIDLKSISDRWLDVIIENINTEIIKTDRR